MLYAREGEKNDFSSLKLSEWIRDCWATVQREISECKLPVLLFILIELRPAQVRTECWHSSESTLDTVAASSREGEQNFLEIFVEFLVRHIRVSVGRESIDVSWLWWRFRVVLDLKVDDKIVRVFFCWVIWASGNRGQYQKSAKEIRSCLVGSDNAAVEGLSLCEMLLASRFIINFFG